METTKSTELESTQQSSMVINKLPSSKKMHKMMKKYKQQMAAHIADAKRRSKAFNRILEKVKAGLTKEEFAKLKQVCTVVTPAQLDENGNQLAPESSDINYRALIFEGNLLIALKREERIKQGLRQRRSGSRAKRAAHRAAIEFIEHRNAVTMLTEDVQKV